MTNITTHSFRRSRLRAERPKIEEKERPAAVQLARGGPAGHNRAPFCSFISYIFH